MGDAMRLVREERGLPVVQLWIPCNCNCICDETNGHDTCLNIAPHLFCLVTSCSDWGIKYQQELNVIQQVPEAYFVNSGGKSCIGRTHSLKKPSFHRYTNFFDISDYPPVTLTRSVGLQACFAIPMNLIHHQLRPSILELFLPPLPVEKDDIGDLVALLKSLLTTLAQVFSSKNATFGLGEGEEFCVEISHEKDYDDDDDIHKFCYFNVCRTTTMNTGGGVGNRILEYDNWDDPMLDQPSNPADDHGQQYHQTIGSLQLLARDHHVQTHETEQHFQSSIQPTTFEASSTQDDIPNQQLEANDDHQIVNVEKQFSSSDQPPSSEAMTSRKSSTSGQIEITLDMIKPHMSIKQKDAADKLGVSKSTLKRRCRDFGINRWPSQTRNKVHQIQPVQGLFTQSVQIDSGGGIQNSNPINNAREKHAAAANSITKSARGKSPATRDDDDEVDQSYTLIVEATYREDIAKFDFCSNSGFEELRRELDENFEFKGERFKIKYKDGDGKLIIMPHDKALRFYMKILKTLGQTQMELSISLVTN